MMKLWLEKKLLDFSGIIHTLAAQSHVCDRFSKPVTGLTMRSRDLSSIGGETDQNLPDDNMFEQEGEDAEHTDPEEGNENNEESDDDPETEENEAEQEEKPKTHYCNLRPHLCP